MVAELWEHFEREKAAADGRIGRVLAYGAGLNQRVGARLER